MLLARKLGLVAATVFLGDNALFQASIALSVLGVAYAVHTACLPFVTPQSIYTAAVDNLLVGSEKAPHALGSVRSTMQPPHRSTPRAPRAGIRSSIVVASRALTHAVTVQGEAVVNFNRLETVLIICSFIMLLSGMVFESTKLPPDSLAYSAMTAFVFVVFGVGTVLFFAMVALETRRTCAPRGVPPGAKTPPSGTENGRRSTAEAVLLVEAFDKVVVQHEGANPGPGREPEPDSRRARWTVNPMKHRLLDTGAAAETATAAPATRCSASAAARSPGSPWRSQLQLAPRDGGVGGTRSPRAAAFIMGGGSLDYCAARLSRSPPVPFGAVSPRRLAAAATASSGSSPRHEADDAAAAWRLRASPSGGPGTANGASPGCATTRQLRARSAAAASDRRTRTISSQRLPPGPADAGAARLRRDDDAATPLQLSRCGPEPPPLVLDGGGDAGGGS